MREDGGERIVKSAAIAEHAARMYQEGYSIDAIALEMGVAYRTARKAIFSQGVTLRGPSERLIGRTRPRKEVVG